MSGRKLKFIPKDLREPVFARLRDEVARVYLKELRLNDSKSSSQSGQSDDASISKEAKAKPAGLKKTSSLMDDDSDMSESESDADQPEKELSLEDIAQEQAKQ